MTLAGNIGLPVKVADKAITDLGKALVKIKALISRSYL